MHVQRPACKSAALRDDHAFATVIGELDPGRHRVRLVLQVDDRVLGQSTHPGEEPLLASADERGPACDRGVEAFDCAVIEREDAVLRCLEEEEPLHVVQPIGILRREIASLGPVGRRVVELPDVVVERHHLAGDDPGRAVLGDRGPALVVDPAVADHLEVLRRARVRCVGVVEAVGHAHAVQRHLLLAVDEVGLREPGDIEHGRGDVDDVVELMASLSTRLNPVGPRDNGAVARTAPVRRDLLGPLVGRTHRVGPADRIVVVRRRAAEAVDVCDEELGRLEVRGAVEHEHLVDAAHDPALGTGTVVADDHVDERVVEGVEGVEGVEHATDVMVGVLEESGVNLHLALEHRAQLDRHVVVRRNLFRARGELGIGGDHAELLLPGEDLLAQRIPAGGEASAVTVGPLLRHLMRGVRGAGRVVDEERLVGHERLLLAHPRDRAIGHVLGEVVALLGSALRLDRLGPLVDRGEVLVGLATEEAVEVLEPAARRPVVERTHRAGLPHGNLVALAELRRAVSVETQRLGKRRGVLGTHRAVAGRRRRDLGDRAHADGVVVAPGEESLTRRRTQRGRVEAGELQPALGETLHVRGRTRSPECARRGKAHVVEQDDEHVGCPGRRAQRHDRREGRVGIPCVVRRQARSDAVGDREHGPRRVRGRHSPDHTYGLPRAPSESWSRGEEFTLRLRPSRRSPRACGAAAQLRGGRVDVRDPRGAR